MADDELPSIDYQDSATITPIVSSEKPQSEMSQWYNLPTTATFFIGREAELAKLADLLADPMIRLLTIVGPGGVANHRRFHQKKQLANQV